MNQPVRCAHCGTEIGPSVTLCPGCGWLVHSGRLKELAETARTAARENRLADALAAWREALELLPPESRQYPVVQAEASRISEQIAATPTAELRPSSSPVAAAKLPTARGVLGVLSLIVVVLFKFKAVLFGAAKWSTLWTMMLSIGVYWTVWGWKFAAAVVVGIYIHEMGHIFMMRRFGLRLSAPLFIPGVGAFVELKQHPVNPIEDARIGIFGPIWGMAAAGICFALGRLIGSAFWESVAHFLAWITIFNLVPLWQLDGARAFRALDVTARFSIAILSGGLWLWAREGILLLVGGIALLSTGGAAARTDRWSYIYFIALLVLATALVKYTVTGTVVH